MANSSVDARWIRSRVFTEPEPRTHERVQESPSRGAAAGAYGASDLGAASVVVDVSDAPSFVETQVVEFFEIATAYYGDVEHSFRLISSAGFD